MPSASTRGYELADAYFRRGNFSSAYLVGLPAAHAGDPRAQYMLGLMSFHGLGPVTRNLAESARWFSLAAARGHGESQFALAQAYARATASRSTASAPSSGSSARPSAATRRR